MLEAFTQLKAEQPNALLMIAPRHPDRVSDILAMPAIRWYHLVRHSVFQHRAGAKSDAGAATGVSLTIEDDVLVIDTLGRLGALRKCADAVFVGGSLIPHGATTHSRRRRGVCLLLRGRTHLTSPVFTVTC